MKLMDKLKGLRGEVGINVFRHGQLCSQELDHNLIVYSGRNALANLLGGGRSGGITALGVGEGETAATDEDVGLTNATLLEFTSITYEPQAVTFYFTIGTDQCNGKNIHEFGLFFDDGTMFSRRVRKSVIAKADDISIEGYWKIYL